ncbi:MAG: hypothetical protein II881_05335 [Oscillospiraceae bacterium]|nr:hypothetical protein [Oscillospiraceae bacterium]
MDFNDYEKQLKMMDEMEKLREKERQEREAAKKRGEIILGIILAVFVLFMILSYCSYR